MVDKSSVSPRGSASPSKSVDCDRCSGPAAPISVSSAPAVAQNETPIPVTSPPMEPEDSRILPKINTPIAGDRQVPTSARLDNSQPQLMPAPILSQNGTFFPGTASPMETDAVYRVPFMPTMGFYRPVMPRPYASYQPHPVNFPVFTNGSIAPQQYTGTKGDQSQFNGAYRPLAKMVSFPSDCTTNRFARPHPFPSSANESYKDAHFRKPNDLPLPSFHSLENATGRSVSGEPSQVRQMYRPPWSNPPTAKKRRVEISMRGPDEIQANSMNRFGRPIKENGILPTVAKEMPQRAANASIAAPSKESISELPNTGSTQKSTAESSKKSYGNMNISDIVHPTMAPAPQPNPTHTGQSAEPLAFRDVAQIGSQNAPTAPYPGAPVFHIPQMIGIHNPGSNYFGNPYQNPYKYYPGISSLFSRPGHQHEHPQSYGNTPSGQVSNIFGTHPHPTMRQQNCPAQQSHPIPTKYHNISNVIDPQANNGWQSGHGSKPYLPPPPDLQAEQIAPAPPGSSPDPLITTPAPEHAPNDIDIPERIYDLAAIEKLGCKVLNWKVYNDQNHPLCAAPRENGIPCRRNVSRSPCKWHGAVIPLSLNNTKNGLIDADGNFIRSFTPQDEAPKKRGANTKPLRARAPPTEEVSEVGSRILRWSDKEHFLFLLGYREFGKSWSRIAKVVQTRTTLQTQSHAQKFFERRRKSNKKKTTIHDLVFESPEMQEIYKSIPEEVLDEYLARAFARAGDQNAEEQPHEQDQPNAPGSDE